MIDNYTFTVPGPKHKHKCSKCGCVWEHGSEAAGLGREHSCPLCGDMQWYRYDGPEAVTKVVKDDYTFHLRD